MLTVEQVQHALPANLKRSASQSLVDRINNAVSDPEHAEAIRQNFLSYTKVLQEGRFKVEDYLNAVMYVSYKLMGYTNRDAYSRTFPQRFQNLLARGTSEREISAYVSMYNKGRLVNLILEQSLVPSWVLNQHLYQKALNVQADLMKNAKSEMARVQAANSILTHLTKPKEAGPLVNIDLGGQAVEGLNELKATMASLAKQQKELIEAGMSPKTVAAQAIVEVKPEDS